MSKKPAPNKKELAAMKVLSDMGHSPTAIAKKIGKSHHTVIKYLEDQRIFDDPEVQKLIKVIRDKELNDLLLIGVKARKRLHELLDEGKTKAIETTAIMDRSFQQRRLLENNSTSNLLISEISGDLDEIRKRKKAIQERIKALQGHE